MFFGENYDVMSQKLIKKWWKIFHFFSILKSFKNKITHSITCLSGKFLPPPPKKAKVMDRNFSIDAKRATAIETETSTKLSI